MKRSTLAKRLGFEFLRRYRIPFYNHVGNTVKSRATGTIRTKYLSSIDDFDKYFTVSIKPGVKDGDKLKPALAKINAEREAKRNPKPKDNGILNNNGINNQ